jgi:hypothetical protein
MCLRPARWAKIVTATPDGAGIGAIFLPNLWSFELSRVVPANRILSESR